MKWSNKFSILTAYKKWLLLEIRLFANIANFLVELSLICMDSISFLKETNGIELILTYFTFHTINKHFQAKSSLSEL